MQTIQTSFSPILVLLSYVISVIGSFTALQLARQISQSDPRQRRVWLLAAAFAMGGGAIWSMHFIGMLAFDMGMPVSYDVPLTIASLLLAVVVTGIGLFVVSRERAGIGSLLAAGVLMGLGVAGMHYTGMAAMRMHVGLSYDQTLLILSIVIAVVASTVALWLAFNLRKAWQMVASALVMGAAVCGMHYTGMAAARFQSSGTMVMHDVPDAIPPALLAYAVFLISLVILAIGLALARGRVQPVSVSG